MIVLAFVAASVAALTNGARAAGWWGRKLPDAPTQFIFGYGSLINTASRNSTASAPIPAIPVRVSAAFGYVRAWNDRSPSGFTALGLRKPHSGESANTINGVLYPVEGDDMSKFDAREEGYARVEVPREDIEAVSWQRLPEAGHIWVYVPVRQGGVPGEGLPKPDASFRCWNPTSMSSSKARWNTARIMLASSSKPRRIGATTGSTTASSHGARGCMTAKPPRSTSSSPPPPERPPISPPGCSPNPTRSGG